MKRSDKRNETWRNYIYIAVYVVVTCSFDMARKQTENRRGDEPRTRRRGRIACMNRSIREMKLDYYRNLHYAVIIKRWSVRRRTGSVSRHDLQHSPIFSLSPTSPLPSAYPPTGRAFSLRFAIPPLVPPLHLPSSLIKGSNYATSSRLSFSGFLLILFPRPPSAAIFPHCVW